jgi:hypothetical protein
MVKPLVAVALVASVTSLGTVARADELAPAQTAEAPAEPPPEPAAPALAPPSSYQPIAQPAPPPVRDSYVSDETPPLSGVRLVGELAVGSLFAVGGGIGGAYLGFGLEISSGCDGEFCGLGGAVLGGVAGLTFVTPIGVYLVGSSEGQTGSFAATLGGSALGTLAGIVAVAAADSEAGVAMLFAGPVVGSMIGFNLTRKYVDGHKPRNWVPVANVSHGNTSLGVVGRF